MALNVSLNTQLNNTADDICNSISCAIYTPSTCICTKEYLASQYDCAACAMKVTDTDWQTTLVTEEARGAWN